MTLEELEAFIPDWVNNAEVIGEDLGEALGDLAIGPKLMSDLVEHIKELEAKLGS